MAKRRGEVVVDPTHSLEMGEGLNRLGHTPAVFLPETDCTACKPTVGNMVAPGTLLGQVDVVSKDAVTAAFKGDEALIALNRRAVEAGMEEVA